MGGVSSGSILSSRLPRSLSSSDAYGKSKLKFMCSSCASWSVQCLRTWCFEVGRVGEGGRDEEGVEVCSANAKRSLPEVSKGAKSKDLFGGSGSSEKNVSPGLVEEEWWGVPILMLDTQNLE
jgi:hypothetical protein